MKVSVIGTGYVGLVAGVCFSDTGNHVTCVDIDKEKIKKLKNGDPIIYEPGLANLMLKNIKEQRLFFTTDTKKAVTENQIIFIAVGTPPGEDGSADLSYVVQVASDIGEYINEYKVIVNKSTVPVGTAELVKKTIMSKLKNRNIDISFDVVSNPEFLKEGSAIDDFAKPDRVVLGSDSQKALDIMTELYSPFTRTNNRLHLMDNKSAEVTKYAANSILATKISFINEMSLLCEKVGANIDFVRMAIGADSRVGNKFLFPGVGYGGSCFPKDVKAIIKTGLDHGVNMDLLSSVEAVNHRQKKILSEKLLTVFNKKSISITGAKIAIWGLAFKPNTDDMREAPALEAIKNLLSYGCTINAYDPVANDNAKNILGNKVNFFSYSYDVLKNADALLIFTEWNEFRSPDFNKIKQLMNKPFIFDGRNLYDTHKMLDKGFFYFSIGRGNESESF
jgi:UDPglucose 6-dehydrogenase